MNELLHEDLVWCLRRLPEKVLDMLKERAGALSVAGGFIRACISGETPSDIDIFGPSKDVLEAAARKLKDAGYGPMRLHESENAFTVLGFRYPVQFIHRWTYTEPAQVLPSFDFTTAAAAFWYGLDGVWHTACHERFYNDLAAKRLVYTSPIRNEDAGGSILRVLKFYQKGYRIPICSLGSVIARLVAAINEDAILGGMKANGVTREEQLAKIITGLLHEVDPNVDPTHIAHLPALREEAAAEKAKP